jgi:hypothetical protein
MKICKKCLSNKNESEFTIDNSKKDKLTIYCKDCLKSIRQTNKEKYNFSKDYYKKINEERKDYLKSYYQSHKEKIKEYYQKKKNNPI